MRLRAFTYILSRAYRVDLKTVALYARALREAGYLTTGARGVNAPHMTPRDAARMTIALLATDNPSRAVERYERFAKLPLHPGRSEGPHAAGLKIVDGVDFEEVLTQIFAADIDKANPFDAAPYVEIQENARTAKIQYGFTDTGAFFQQVDRPADVMHSDRKELFGIRRSRGLASVELLEVHAWFYLERRDGITWEERHRGVDANGHPLDPAHPWNADLPPDEHEARLREISEYIASLEEA